MRIAIHGDSVAAYGCARLLVGAGFSVTLRRTDRPRLPAILLTDSALALIRGVFGRADLLSDLPRIERRIVAWQPDLTPAAFDHAAGIVSETALLDAIRPDLSTGGPDADFTVLSTRPLPAGSAEYRFGDRMASATPVELSERSDPRVCRMEAVAGGWLFLMPNGGRSGWLLAAGGKLESLIGQSLLIAPEIAHLGSPAGDFPVAPRIAWPLAGAASLACGTAAIGFDPICGDGTANAIREAVLAAAVIRAIAGGAPVEDVLAHYQGRLLLGFERHLRLCLQFYRSGKRGSWWERQCEGLERGIAWSRARMAEQPPFRYRMDGFELHPLPAAADRG